MAAPIRLATRRSRLALAQSQQMADRLAATTGRDVDLVHITTTGDDTSVPIEALGGTGVFVAAVRQALLEGAADIAVHSMKDLPTAPAAGLRLAAVPVREDPRDAMCGAALDALAPGAVVATGSPRRVAQLRAARPDLTFIPIRGNVDTRLARLADGDVHAVVLAAAGLARIGRTDAIAALLPVDVCTPAPAQGALALECRDDLRDTDLAAALAGLDDAHSRAAATAERALLAALEAGCTAPVGAYARIGGTGITLTAAVADIGGTTVIRMSTTGPVSAPEQLGRTLAERMLAAGAADLMGEAVP